MRVGAARSPETRAGLLVLVVAFAALGSCTSEPATSPRAEMAEALRQVRISEGRLCGFDFAAPGPVRLASGPFRRMARIQRELKRRHDPQALADLAITSLAAGRIDDAISRLTRAVEANPKQACWQSDLAALYLTRAKAAGRPHDLVLARSAAERALLLDTDRLEARFNRALALQELSLTQAAREAWIDYLRRGDGTGWTGDARLYLARLQRPTKRSSGSGRGGCNL